MQKGKEKSTRRKIAGGTGNSFQQPGESFKRLGLHASQRGMDFPDRTTIQISQETKSELDRIKQRTGVKSYDEAIRFLLEERKRLQQSTFGLLAGAGPFVRDEEEDSHRIRS